MSHAVAPRLIAAFRTATVVVCVVSPAGAAQFVFADPLGACNGSTPCFTTIQAAIDNAGPAPATVSLFPGVYPESVDVMSMGSAIGLGIGDLTLQGVDAAGSPTTGAALIDPGAPGGPGSGPALTAVDPGLLFLPINLVLRGFDVASPDDDGILAGARGQITLEQLNANGCGARGIAALAEGALTARHLSAVSNVEEGVFLGSATSVDAETLVAEHNDGGILMFAAAGADLRALNLRATANGSGILVSTCGGADLDTLLALSNTALGMQMQQLPPSDPQCAPPAAGWSFEAIQDRLRSSAAGFDLKRLRRQGAKGSLPEGSVPTVRLLHSQALNNGEDGVQAIGSATFFVDDLVATGNGGLGMILAATHTEVTAGTFDGNGGGAAILGARVLLSASSANDNLGGGTSFADGYGFLVGPEIAEISNIEGSRNLEAGLLLGGPPTAPIAVTVRDGRFEGNRAGIEAAGIELLPSVHIEQTDTVANQVGILLPLVANVVVTDSRIENNGIGLRASPTQGFLVRSSNVAGNTVGVGIDGAGGAIQCSNIQTSGSGVGLEVLSSIAIDARTVFWGSPLGPTHPSNPGAAGDAILDSANGAFGTVQFVPFLEAPATPDDCPAIGTPLEVPVSPRVSLVLVLLLALLSLRRLRRPTLVALVGVSVGLGLNGAASAATFTVDRTDDSTSAASCLDNKPLDCSLRGAMWTSNATIGADLIVLPEGLYQLTVPGANEDFALTGDLDVVGSLTIVAMTGTHPVIQQLTDDRIFHPQGGTFGGSFTLIGPMTLLGGVASATGRPASGGSIYAFRNGSLILEDVNLVGATAPFDGGCLYFATAATPGALILEDVRISGCSAGHDGGGLFVQAGESSVSLQRVEIDSNQAARLGGGVFIFGADVTSVVRDSTVRDNLAGVAAGQSGFGGGVGMVQSSVAWLRSTVSGNRAGSPEGVNGQGGGVYADNSSLLIQNSTISGNRVQGGAFTSGSAIHASSSTVGVEFSTIVGTSALGPETVRAVAGSTVTFETSVLEGRCSSPGGMVISSGFNAEKPIDGAPSSTCGLIHVSDVFTAAALLRPLAGYGGPTATHALLEGAIGVLPAVPSTLCNDPVGGPIDQRGAPRTSLFCEPGSYEFGATAPGFSIFSDGFESGSTLAWSTTVPQ